MDIDKIVTNNETNRNETLTQKVKRLFCNDMHERVKRIQNYLREKAEEIMHSEPYQCLFQDTETKKLVRKVMRNYNLSYQALCRLYDLREKDMHTALHGIRLAVAAVPFGRELGLEKEELHDLNLGSLYHDIGKEDMKEVIYKEGKLTDNDWQEITSHPIKTVKVIDEINDSVLKDHGYDGFSIQIKPPVRLMDLGHHKWIMYDQEQSKRQGGRQRSYPDDTIIEEPSMLAQILAITDAFDAMRDKHHYCNGRVKEGLAQNEALAELERESKVTERNKLGVHFNQYFVKVYSKMYSQN